MFTACQEGGDSSYRELRKRNQKGEYLYRHFDEVTLIPPMEARERKLYPWEDPVQGGINKITKEYFRCKGSSSHPAKYEVVKGEKVHFLDCSGSHSLPLRDGKEFIFPILIDLLNYIQEKTGKQVIVTSGHRCPDHNRYINAAAQNRYSKHQIGAEVSFYVKGMEREPGMIVKLLMDYYKDRQKYAGKREYQDFLRYEKKDSNVALQPWYNKEVFIKVFQSHEGRDLDNNHAYPYLSIQVRFDDELQSRVNYSWDLAWKNFLRY